MAKFCMEETDSSSSETQGLLAGTMRYFRAKVYLMCWRAPGNLFLPNQFQKWSNSVPLIGKKNIFLPNQRGALAGVAFSHEAVFFIDRRTFLLSNGKVVWRASEKNISQALTWELGTNNQFSWRVYRNYIVNFYSTRFLNCCFCLRGKLVTQGYFLFFLMNKFWNFARYANPARAKLCRPNVETVQCTHLFLASAVAK